MYDSIMLIKQQVIKTRQTMKMSEWGVALSLWIILFMAIAVAGCYENDPMAQPVTADKVAGIYEFTQFEFVPNDDSVAPVNMLDTLISLTELKLGTDDRFVLSYHFDGGAQRSIGGAMKVNARDVLLEVESGNEEALSALLLGDMITLKREDMQLRASISDTLDPTSFVALREGSSPTGGIVEIRLRPRAAH